MRLYWITTRDILTGFLRNYDCLRIDIEGNFTSWTYKSMDYFHQLGKLLGYWVEFEDHRYDQVWYKFVSESKYFDEEELVLHIEHENNKSRINHTIEKLVRNTNRPKAKKKIGIVYPKEKDFAEEITDFSKRDVGLIKKNEEMAVLFLEFTQTHDESGYWPAEIVRKYKFKQKVETKNYRFRMKENANGILYTVFND